MQHLGLNLYSNVPAVLSEVVANAWDADAGQVRIALNKAQGRIVIEDDGCGMTRDEVVDRFLLVGYQRRLRQPGRTPERGRSPMGRKGIGKLSLFSIANLITVETTRDGERTALRMHLDAVRVAIEDNQGEYQPDELSNFRVRLPARHTYHTRGAAQAPDRQHGGRVAPATGEAILDHRPESRLLDHGQR